MALKTAGGQQLPINVVGSSTFGRYNKISSEKTYNMFISDEWMVNFGGYKRVSELFPNGIGRALFRSVRGNFLIAVINSAVFRFDTNLASTQIGTLASSFGEVYIDENLSNQICLVDGINAYIYNHNLPADPSNFVIQSLASDLVPNYVTYHNTFFLFGNGNKSPTTSSNWYAYQANTGTNPTTIVIVPGGGGTFAMQTKPDYPIAVKRIPGQASNVLVFGNSVCEVYTQIGGQQNYRRNNTISVDYGCISVSTINCSDQYVVWLGVNESDSTVIMVYTGQGVTPISTDGIDYQLGQIKFPAQSTAMFSRLDGHLIYQLTFYNPADNLTIAYDFDTQKFFNFTDHRLNYHPAQDYVFFNNKTYFVSLGNASLYEISTDITVIDENVDGDDSNLIFEIPRIRICANIMQDDSDRFVANYFTMTMEQGNDPRVSEASLDVETNIITEDIFPAFPDYPILTEWGANIVTEDSWGGGDAYVMPYQPRVDLTISNDGGISWSSTVSRDLHTVGNRKNIISWNKLGLSNSITLKLCFHGLSRFVVSNGVLEIY